MLEHVSPTDLPADRHARERSVLETVLNTIPHSIFWKDCDLKFLGCNQAFANNTGLNDPSEIVGLTDYDLWCSKEEADFYRACDQRVIDTGEQLFDIEEPLTLGDGRVITLLTSKILLRDQDGNTIGILGSFLDITERKLLEQQLAQAMKLESIGQLAAGLAHEINTPMQFVSQNVEFISASVMRILEIVDRCEHSLETDQPVDWSQRRKELQELKESSRLVFLRSQITPAISDSREGIDRIVNIISAMRDFAHPGVKDKGETDVNRQIESTVAISRNRWKDLAEMELDLCPTLPAIEAFASEINQVFLNLVINSCDAIEDRYGAEATTPDRPVGRITIRTRCEDDQVVIEVEDNGCGIPAEARDKVFDMFYTSKQVGRGTGQGLSMVQKVVAKRHDGSVGLESRVGVGTTFTVRLPIASA